jgi:hypothetical protein
VPGTLTPVEHRSAVFALGTAREAGHTNGTLEIIHMRASGDEQPSLVG